MFMAFVIFRLAHVHVKAYVRIVCAQNELWQKAKDYPLASFLSDKSSYIFKSVTQDAETEEFYDETRRYCIRYHVVNALLIAKFLCEWLKILTIWRLSLDMCDQLCFWP